MECMGLILVAVVIYVLWSRSHQGELEFIATDVNGAKYKGKCRYSGFWGHQEVQEHVARKLRGNGLVVSACSIEIIAHKRIG